VDQDFFFKIPILIAGNMLSTYMTNHWFISGEIGIGETPKMRSAENAQHPPAESEQPRAEVNASIFLIKYNNVYEK